MKTIPMISYVSGILEGRRDRLTMMRTPNPASRGRGGPSSNSLLIVSCCYTPQCNLNTPLHTPQQHHPSKATKPNMPRNQNLHVSPITGRMVHLPQEPKPKSKHTPIHLHKPKFPIRANGSYACRPSVFRIPTSSMVNFSQ